MSYPALHLSLGNGVKSVDGNWDDMPRDVHEHILRFNSETLPRVERVNRSGFMIYAVRMCGFSLTFDAGPIRTFLEETYSRELLQHKDDLSCFDPAAITQEIIKQIVFIATLSFELPTTSQLYETLKRLPDSGLEQDRGSHGRVLLKLGVGQQPSRTTRALNILFKSMVVRQLWHAIETGLRSETTRQEIERHDLHTEWKQMPLYEQLILPLLSSIGPIQACRP